MNITKRQLRRLIETTIKPSIPNIPSGEAYTKIDDLARQEEFQPSADSLAGAFGYPEDRSYSDDLRIYDEAGRYTLETVEVRQLPGSGIAGSYIGPPIIDVVIPRELVDDVIDAHLKSHHSWAGASVFREAALRVFDHVENEARRIASEMDHEFDMSKIYIFEYGLKVRGYRADEYNAAMNAAGEYI